VAYWTACRLQPCREALALHCLEQIAGYQTYLPRLREHRTVRGKRVEVHPALFPGYCFVLIALQWHAAAKAPGVSHLTLTGDGVPARIPDSIIQEIRSRAGRDGLVDLPPPPGPQPGERIRITHGPLCGRLAIYAGMKPRQRAEVLVALLGRVQRVELPARSLGL
jgi:transcriptional antiterminator RfaH